MRRLESGPMFLLLIAFAVAAAFTLWLVRSSKRHAHLSHDHDFDGPQKFHARAVPRIGGAGIVAGLVAAALTERGFDTEMGWAFMTLLACGVPAFAVGLIEDLTKRVSPSRRLLATMASATLAFVLMDAAIRHTDIPGLDWVAATTLGALFFTVLAVTGIANSINIIDGFNGLASMCVVIMLGAICYVAYLAGDPLVGALALAGIGAVLGFFVWNFPGGLIFLGDGGAYFLGFYVAELAILLFGRNPEVSPICPLLVCIYPIFETLFSIYRRRFLRAMPSTVPDGIHLHSLVYRRIMRWASGSDPSPDARTRHNSMTSPYLWALCMLSAVPALVFWNNTVALAICLLLFCVVYVALYWRIVRFKSPRWLRPRRTEPVPLEELDGRAR